MLPSSSVSRLCAMRRTSSPIGSLDNQTRKNAEAAAHKLAGVLGTFGLPEGSKLASKIEDLLAQET